MFPKEKKKTITIYLCIFTTEICDIGGHPQELFYETSKNFGDILLEDRCMESANHYNFVVLFFFRR